MTFTLIEWLKEAQEDLLHNQTIEVISEPVEEITSQINNVIIDDSEQVCLVFINLISMIICPKNLIF